MSNNNNKLIQGIGAGIIITLIFAAPLGIFAFALGFLIGDLIANGKESILGKLNQDAKDASKHIRTKLPSFGDKEKDINIDSDFSSARLDMLETHREGFLSKVTDELERREAVKTATSIGGHITEESTPEQVEQFRNNLRALEQVKTDNPDLREELRRNARNALEEVARTGDMEQLERQASISKVKLMRALYNNPQVDKRCKQAVDEVYKKLESGEIAPSQFHDEFRETTNALARNYMEARAAKVDPTKDLDSAVAKYTRRSTNETSRGMH